MPVLFPVFRSPGNYDLHGVGFSVGLVGGSVGLVGGSVGLGVSIPQRFAPVKQKIFMSSTFKYINNIQTA